MTMFLFTGTFYSLSGWIGAIVYLVAYFLLAIHRLRADSLLYHLLNLIGAAGLIINALSLKDNPNVVVNVAWALIALYAMSTIFGKRQHR